jgi:hypothetical protein
MLITSARQVIWLCKFYFRAFAVADDPMDLSLIHINSSTRQVIPSSRAKPRQRHGLGGACVWRRGAMNFFMGASL